MAEDSNLRDNQTEEAEKITSKLEQKYSSIMVNCVLAEAVFFLMLYVFSTIEDQVSTILFLIPLFVSMVVVIITSIIGIRIGTDLHNTTKVVVSSLTMAPPVLLIVIYSLAIIFQG